MSVTLGVLLTIGVSMILARKLHAREGVVRPAEMQQRDQWSKQHLSDTQAQMPFSFVYGDQPSEKLLAEWPRTQKRKRLDASRSQLTVTWTDAKNGLEVRCISVEYSDFPAIEWTVYFKNTGKQNTPIFRDIRSLDTLFQKTDSRDFILNGNKGDYYVREGYEPTRRVLKPNTTHNFAPDGGRPTNGANGWPYYNIQWSDGGVMMAIGWPGQWASSFIRDDQNGLRIVAGQELTHLSLKPGEQIRTPLMALLFWQGADLVRAQNLWRRWFMTHNIPKINGKPPAPIAQMQLSPACKGSEQEQWREARSFAEAGIDIDVYWNDAGWYPCGADPSWPLTGTWEVDRVRYPRGFKPLADWIHARGKKLIVWFEPERIGDPNSWLPKNHPDWILGGALLNMGHPEAQKWVLEHTDNFMRENGIDYYRQDFNIDPLSFWRANDAPDRQGITENLHVQGYLAFWDELRRRHPGMLIDSCASGGRRNDMETLRRAVPLLRSDYQPAKDWEAQHGQTYGISSWIPYYGSGVYSVEKYPARSYYMPAFGLGGNQDMKKAKALYDECRIVAPLMLGDYYPLTSYTLAPERWIAWQFDRPEQGDGVIQAFRHDTSEENTKRFRLCGLDRDAQYELTNFDTEGTTRVSGKELMEKGLVVTISDQPGVAIITYRRTK